MKRRYDIYRRREPILPIVVTTVGLTLAACAVALILLAMAGVSLH